MRRRISLMLLCLLWLTTGYHVLAAEETDRSSWHKVPGSDVSLSFVENKGIISRQAYSELYLIDTKFGVKANVNMISRLAEKTYRIAFDIPSDCRLELPEMSKRDGSLLIIDNTGQLTGAIEPMKIYDVNGLEIPVEVSFNGNIAEYTINDMERSIQYPLQGSVEVYADAHAFSTWFEKGWWETRGGYITLSLVPTPNWHSFDATTAQISWSWNTVKNKFSGSSNWRNETGLNDQYYCHVIGSAMISDNEWNLEPDRPSVGTWETIKAKCNP